MEYSSLNQQGVVIWLNAWLSRKYPDLNTMESDDLLIDSGLTSVESVELCFDLSEKIGLEIDPTSIWDYPTLDDFSLYVEQLQIKTGKLKEKKASESSESDAMEAAAKGKHITDDDAIAIVGISGRFPMAEDIDAYWDNLIAEKDCISTIPESRWDWRSIYGDPSHERNKTNIKWGGFISGVDQFDPLFFGISPREAELMDPQQRLAMTYVYKAIEDAGYSPSHLAGTKTGVFIGTGSEGYAKLVERANLPIEGVTATGLVPSIGPNRISYFFDFRGPSEPIETACSSSLVALHRAREAIRSGSCSMAIVGGVNTIVTPDFHISFSKAGMLSDDGRCKTFSENANGYVRSEGVGMLFVKRLSDAERDGDHIYGVVRGSAENHGGRSKSLTAPNSRAQAELLTSAYSEAGVRTNDVSFIEAHGTGTKLGDPIEINGLKTAFSDIKPDDGLKSCALGSVKSNIGHLELAAGVAGVIKVLLQFKHNKLVKSLHCDELNPYINLENSPFYILQESQDWPYSKDENGERKARIAGVSSFGFGGVNAHIVIEEYLPKIDESNSVVANAQAEMIVLSSQSEPQLQQQVDSLLLSLKNNHIDTSIADIAFTLQLGRDHMRHRLAFAVSSVTELIERLERYTSDESRDGEVFYGEAKESAQIVKLFDDDDALQTAISTWVENQNQHSLLSLWVKGLKFDWCQIERPHQPRRVNLPGYAFMTDRYWVPTDNINDKPRLEKLHPFLHKNTSTLLQQRFTTEFNGNETIFVDHQISNQRVLPGVAYLEWMYAAVKHSIDGISHLDIRVHNIIWVKPIILTGLNPVEFHIDCNAEGERIEMEIYSLSDDANRIVHLQGSATIANTESTRQHKQHDLVALKADCQVSAISAEPCYAFFALNDFVYGHSQQGIKHLYIGENQVIGHLKLPENLESEAANYVLHPCLFDSALQACLGLLVDAGGLEQQTKLEPHMPFALAELAIHQSLGSELWVVLRLADNGQERSNIPKIDIDFCDEDGVVCAQMYAYTHKKIMAPVVPLVPSKSPSEGLVADNDRSFLEQDYLEILTKIKTESMSRESFSELVIKKISG